MPAQVHINAKSEFTGLNPEGTIFVHLDVPGNDSKIYGRVRCLSVVLNGANITTEIIKSNAPPPFAQPGGSVIARFEDNASLGPTRRRSRMSSRFAGARGERPLARYSRAREPSRRSRKATTWCTTRSSGSKRMSRRDAAPHGGGAVFAAEPSGFAPAGLPLRLTQEPVDLVIQGRLGFALLEPAMPALGNL